MASVSLHDLGRALSRKLNMDPTTVFRRVNAAKERFFVLFTAA